MHAFRFMPIEQLIRILGDQESLDSVATPLQEAIRSLFASAGTAGREAKDFLHGSALGHPLHPALIALPVGAWTLAAILDALEVAGLNGDGDLADTAIGIGIAGAVGAAVAGVTDWSETDGRAKRIGLTHGVMNLTATGLYALALLARRSRAKRIALSMTAFSVATASAILGGHLSFGEQIGVDHTATAEQDTPKDFVAVDVDAATLAGNQPVKATVEGVAIVLVRQGDSIYALRDTCSHLGGPLSEGTVEGDGIRCPWHGSRFCLKDGRVLDGPAVFPERTFDVRVREGRIEVRARRQ